MCVYHEAYACLRAATSWIPTSHSVILDHIQVTRINQPIKLQGNVDDLSIYSVMSIIDKTSEAFPFRKRIYRTTVTIDRRKCSSIPLERSESSPYFLPPQISKIEFLSSHMLSLDADNLCTGSAGTFLLSNHTFPTQSMPSDDSHLACYFSIGSPSAVSSPTQSGE